MSVQQVEKELGQQHTGQSLQPYSVRESPIRNAIIYQHAQIIYNIGLSCTTKIIV